jgi:cell division protein FtsX
LYFLKAALSGMRRRLVPSVLAILGGSALLTAAAAIGLWSFWLMGQQNHFKAARSASVFIESAEPSAVEEALTRVMEIKGVETARIVTKDEFQAFLKQHFPDLHEALAALGDDVVPRMLEVVFPADTDTFTRKETVSAIANVAGIARVDDGSLRLGRALRSLLWLGYGGLVLAIGLWVVLFIVALGHYQNILYTDSQEIQLIRSFGATKAAILLPWLIEAFVHSFATGLLCVIAMLTGKNYLSELYNQFFGTIGYDAFNIDTSSFLLAAGGVVGMALLAHVLAGVAALLRGRIA